MDKRVVAGVVISNLICTVLSLIWVFIYLSTDVQNVPTTTAITPTVNSIIPTVNVFKPYVSQEFECKNDHILPSGENIYVSVCLYRQDIIVDIRVFLMRSHELYPTVKGIHLNRKQ